MFLAILAILIFTIAHYFGNDLLLVIIIIAHTDYQNQKRSGFSNVDENLKKCVKGRICNENIWKFFSVRRNEYNLRENVDRQMFGSNVNKSNHCTYT